MKKRILTLALTLAMCLGLAVPAFAAEDAPKPVATVKGDDFILADDDTDVVLIKSGGKYGAYSTDGKELAAPAYADAKAYSDGMAAVTKEGAMKVIFDWEWDEEEQAMYEDDGKIWAFEGGKYGYLDETGKLAIPMKYAKAFPFADGRAFVRETADGPLLMIDKTGKTIASYDNVNLWYYETVQFSEGLAIIPVKVDKDDEELQRYLVVDTSGKVVYTQDEGYLDFEHGYHDGLVATAESGFWGTGGPCLERGFNDMEGTGYKDKTGKKVISGDYDYISAFSDGMAAVSQYDEDWEVHTGFINTSGKLVVPMEYADYYWPFENGIGMVTKNGEKGALVDKTGKLLTDFIYTANWGFDKNGLALVRVNGGPVSVIDKTGKTVFTTKSCTSGAGFYSGIAIMLDSKTNTGYIFDMEGNDITPMAHSSSFIFDSGYVWLLNGSTWSVFATADLTGGSSEPDPVTPAAPEFTDVPDTLFCADAVKWAVEQSITNGTEPTKFSPSNPCTQVQILTFLYRAARGADGTVTAATAADMQAAVDWAKEKGIIDDSFEPNKGCTRATAVSYIWQAFESPEADPASFADVEADAAYAAAVSWALENGITNGTSEKDNTFSPDEVCNRGQIVTFLHRAYVEEARLTPVG